MNKLTKIIGSIVMAIAVLLSVSCKNEVSNTTGWKYNNAENGGFEVAPYIEQATGPGLVFIEGGKFTMGDTDDDVMFDWTTMAREITVPSFYMDKYEVANVDYREYLFWLDRVFTPADLKVVYDNAMPDQSVWRDRLSAREQLVEYYLWQPAYNDYPVVGVSWLQASEYAIWRTNRVNEQILINHGFINWSEPSAEGYFDTDAYLTYTDEYEANSDRRLQYIATGEYRDVKMEDGILLPKYRLPTESEWEYAAVSLIGNSINGRVLERRVYPWNGTHFRTDDKRYAGDFMANVRVARGDYMGSAGSLNDAGVYTTSVKAYFPNDYGLYNMAGNVAEWVMDIYRQPSHSDVTELSPYRGNYYMTKQLLEDGTVTERDSIGKIPMVPVSDFKNDRRRNYRQADNRNYLDGDWASLVASEDWGKPASEASTDQMYRKSTSKPYEFSLVSDYARVYKGGSWADIQYWASPAQRRYLDQDESTDYIGFRCAMDRMGGQVQGK